MVNGNLVCSTKLPESAMFDACSHCTETGTERRDRQHNARRFRSAGNESRQANEHPSTPQRNAPRCQSSYEIQATSFQVEIGFD